MTNYNEIKCPKCGHLFQAEEVYKQEIETKVYNEFDKKVAEATEQAIEKQKQKIDELLKKTSEQEDKLKEQQKLELQVAELQNFNQKIKSDLDIEIQKAVLIKENELQKANENKINEFKKLYEENQKNSENQIRKELEEQINLQKANEMNKIKLQQQNEFENKFQELELKYKLELKERDEKLSQTTKQAEELNRKLNQGSMQVQGEAQEKLLTEMLQELFPTDKIEQKTTGKAEADIKQIIVDKVGYQNTECGIIQYESKNTQTWSNAWIDKLISDGEISNADALVLVTQTMPANNKEIHMIKNVLVCPFKDIKGVALILRNGLINTYKAKGSQINKADKMEQLYNFLLSPIFKNYMENIYFGISKIKTNYEQERKSLEKIWKQREKEFENIKISCINLIGTIEGLGVPALGIDALDLKLLAENNENLSF